MIWWKYAKKGQKSVKISSDPMQNGKNMLKMAEFCSKLQKSL
jgi:hypothetical protein